MFGEHVLREMRGVLAGTERPTPKTLIEIVEMFGRCRATVIRWLKALEAQGFVRREVVVHGGGDLGPCTILHSCS